MIFKLCKRYLIKEQKNILYDTFLVQFKPLIHIINLLKGLF